MRRTWLKAFVAAMIACASARGQIVYDLHKLVDSSDVVAKVRALSVVQTGSATANLQGRTLQTHTKVVMLQVDCLMKGDVTDPQLSVPYTLLYSPNGWSGGVPPGYSIADPFLQGISRLVFLKKSNAGYEFTNGSTLAIVSATDSRCSAAPDAFARTVEAIIDVLFSGTSSQQDRRQALLQLGAIKDPRICTPLKRFVSGKEEYSDASLLRAQALAAILDQGDLSVADWAMAELAGPALFGSKEGKVNLLFAVQRTLPPARSAPIIGEALSSSDAELRTYAARALDQTNSTEAISVLLTAFYDPDPQVSFAVMQGLGNITREYTWRPTTTDLDAHWYDCLIHWRKVRDEWTRKKGIRP